MKKIKIISHIQYTLFLLVFVLLSACGNKSGDDEAGQTKTLKLTFQSSENSGSYIYVEQERWAARVAELTQGQIRITMVPVEAIVKHSETLEAISAGFLDGHITASGYFSGKDPAFGLLGNTVGAWSQPEEMLRFIEEGGGRELYDELLTPYGVKFIGAITTGLEALVSKVPINGVADLKGLKIRAPEGLVQSVFSAAGASPVNLPSSEVYTSLDKGLIDAADYTVFSVNHQQGMHDIAAHPVYPGFHSVPSIDVSMNLKKWSALSSEQQTLLQQSVKEMSDSMLEILRQRDEAAVAEAKASGKITVHDWSAEEREKFRMIAQNEWLKFAEKSASARKVYDTLVAWFEKQ